MAMLNNRRLIMPIIWCSMPVVCWSCASRNWPIKACDPAEPVPFSSSASNWSAHLPRPASHGMWPSNDWNGMWKPMETYGNPWKRMETHGNPWKPSYVKGQPRQPTFNLRRYKTPEPPWLWPKLWWNSPAPGKRSEITTVGKKNDFQSFSWRIQHQIASLLLNILLNCPKSRCHII